MKLLKDASQELTDDQVLHILKNSMLLYFKVCLFPYPPRKFEKLPAHESKLAFLNVGRNNEPIKPTDKTSILRILMYYFSLRSPVPAQHNPAVLLVPRIFIKLENRGKNVPLNYGVCEVHCLLAIRLTIKGLILISIHSFYSTQPFPIFPRLIQYSALSN